MYSSPVHVYTQIVDKLDLKQETVIGTQNAFLWCLIEVLKDKSVSLLFCALLIQC